MIRLVLFDIDGTLLHTGGAGGRALGRAWQMVYGQDDPIAAIDLGGRTDGSLFEELYARHEVEFDRQRHETFVALYLHLLHEYLDGTSGGELSGGFRLVSELRRAASDVSLGLLTGNMRLAAEIKLRRYGFWEPFEVGAFGDDHPCRNQLAALARSRAERLRGGALSGDEVMIIGDTPCDVACAQSIGAVSVAVTTGSASFETLQAAKPDFLVEDLMDLDWQSASQGGLS